MRDINEPTILLLEAAKEVIKLTERYKGEPLTTASIENLNCDLHSLLIKCNTWMPTITKAPRIFVRRNLDKNSLEFKAENSEGYYLLAIIDLIRNAKNVT